MVHRIIPLSLLGFLLLFVQACYKDDFGSDGTDPCVKTRDTFELVSPYNSWFSRIKTGYYRDSVTLFKSNNGLHESMNVTKYTVSYDEYLIRESLHIPEIDPCIKSKCNGFLIEQASSMYGFSFDYKLVQYVDGTHICFRDFGSIKYGYLIWDYNITTKEGNKIINHTNGTQITDFKPTFENVIIHLKGQRLSVYKIVNTFTLNEGSDLEIVAIYIEKDRGVVRFDQKNGVFWEIDN